MSNARKYIHWAELLALTALVCAAAYAAWQWFVVPFVLQSELRDVAREACKAQPKCYATNDDLVFDQQHGRIQRRLVILMHRDATTKQRSSARRAVEQAVLKGAQAYPAWKRDAIEPVLHPEVRDA